MDGPAVMLADYQREVLRASFRDALARGEARPLLLPWFIVPSFVLPVLYLALPHLGDGGSATRTAVRRMLRSARVPLALAIAALNADMLRGPMSSLNMACAYGAGFLAAWGTMWSLTVLVWMDPQRDAERVNRRPRRDTHNAGTKTPAPDESVARSLRQGFEYYWQAYPADASFWVRLGWALDLCLSWRGSGWNWAIPALPRFRPPTRPHTAELVRLDSLPHRSRAGYRRRCTYAGFFCARLLSAAAGYLVIDSILVLMSQDPYFVLGPPPDSSRPWIEQPPASFLARGLPTDTFLALPPILERLQSCSPFLLDAYHSSLGSIYIIAGLHLVMYVDQISRVLFGLVCDIVGVPGLRTPRMDIWQYPSIFGGIDQVLDLGLAGVWGSFWHQTFRSAFAAPAGWLVRIGWIKSSSTTHRFVSLIVAFLQSALLHSAGSLTSAGRARVIWWHTSLFFVLSGVGITAQELGCRLLTAWYPKWRPPRLWCRVGNLIFAVVWMQATQHLLMDDIARGGMWLFETLPFSPVRWFLYGNITPGSSSRAGHSAWRWYADDMPRWHTGEHWWQSGLAI